MSICPSLGLLRGDLHVNLGWRLEPSEPGAAQTEGLTGEAGTPVWESQFHMAIICSQPNCWCSEVHIQLSAGAGSKAVLAFGLIWLGGGSMS